MSSLRALTATLTLSCLLLATPAAWAADDSEKELAKKVIASFFVSALSVSGAIFLILEMYAPYAGLVQISNAPLRAALAQLGQ